MFHGTILMCSYLHKKCCPSEEGGCLNEIPNLCRHVCTWDKFREYHCPHRDTEDDQLLGIDFVMNNKCLVCSYDMCPLLKTVTVFSER